jgi:hypothetical protein
MAASRRSSVCASALLAVFALGSCGGDSRREQVDRYLKDVNTIQEGFAPDYQHANDAYASFSQGKTPPAEAVPRLRKAEAVMRETRDQVASLEAPREARALRRRLVALFDADARFAHETTLLAEYLPAAASATRPLSAANRRLQRGLARRPPAAQASALREYARAVTRVWDSARGLHPPPILFDQHNAQLRRFSSVADLARRLATGIRRRQAARVARLLLRFRKIAASRDPSSAALPARALKAYDQRYEGVKRAVQAAERERTRLERRFGG